MRLFVISVLLGCLYRSEAQDITAGTLTVKTPAPATGTYVPGTQADITFDLVYTVTGSVTPTAVKVYFSDATGSTKTTPEVTATGSNAPTSGGSAITMGDTYTDLEASITLDATNCVAYTKLCVNIEISETDATPADNEQCNNFGTTSTSAGTKDCQDLVAGTFTLKTPDPTTTGFAVGTATPVTFDLGYSVVGTGGSVTDVKVYFSNADGSTKSTEVVAGGANAPSGAVSSGTEWTDLTATVTLDATNCEAYTKQCASITAADSDTSNNEACAEFGQGATKAGTKPTCPAVSPADCSDPGPAPTNGQKSGTDYTHGSTVTYTCDSGFTLSGEGTLTCDDGEWNHAVPTCTDDSGSGIPTLNLYAMLTLMFITAYYQL